MRLFQRLTVQSSKVFKVYGRVAVFTGADVCPSSHTPRQRNPVVQNFHSKTLAGAVHEPSRTNYHYSKLRTVGKLLFETKRPVKTAQWMSTGIFCDWCWPGVAQNRSMTRHNEQPTGGLQRISQENWTKLRRANPLLWEREGKSSIDHCVGFRKKTLRITVCYLA